MPGELVSPETTLAIIAGASRFPKSPNLASGAPFRDSANDFSGYLTSEEGFALPEANLLNLFDCEKGPADVIEQIEQFLETRQAQLEGTGGARDMIFYYVGHGGFASDQSYFLALHGTKEGTEGPTSLRVVDLASVIKRHAGTMRRFLILDCCFAAKAYQEFQSGPLAAARVQTLEALPSVGTTLLCSSGSRMVSLAPQAAKHTMFSGALLKLLLEGIPTVNRPLSMAMLGEQVRLRIRKEYPEEAVRPEVLSPDQREDDLKDVPLFPNAAVRRRNFDCIITINDEENLAIEYLGHTGKHERLAGALGQDPFATLAVQRLNEWVNIGVKLQQEKAWKGNPCSPDDLKIIGVNLFRILFCDPRIRQVFEDLFERFTVKYQAEKAANGASDLKMRLRLTFHRHADEISRLPWEFLYVPGPADAKHGFFFAGERTELILTRYVVPSMTIGDPKPEPLRILVAIYTPTGERGITETEEKALITRLKTLTPHVVVIRDESWQKLSAKLATEKPHIFHFVGYGRFDERGKSGGIALVRTPEDEDGLYDPSEGQKPVLPLVGADLLSLFDYEPKPRLMFLHACQTSSANSAEAFRSQEAFKSCAHDLVFEKIPAVIAMQYSMSNNELVEFAMSMYGELAKGRGLDEAVKAGRLKLGSFFLPKWGHPRFGTPLVFLRNDDPLVLPPPEEHGAGETQKGEGRADLTTGSVAALPSRGRAGEASAPAPPASEEPAKQKSPLIG